MAKSNYYELLRRPEWQRKRLEIMQRDDFACKTCGSRDNTLNVHHGYYAKDAMPWDYQNDTLHTLCESCHEDVESAMRFVKFCIGLSCSPRTIDTISGYAAGLALLANDDAIPTEMMLNPKNRDVLAGLSSALGIDASRLADLFESIDGDMKPTEIYESLAEIDRAQVKALNATNALAARPAGNGDGVGTTAESVPQTNFSRPVTLEAA